MISAIHRPRRVPALFAADRSKADGVRPKARF
jgi:hypothetical protein